MPAKFRELRGLRENELTETRTRKRAHLDRGAALGTKEADEQTSSSESDAASDLHGHSSEDTKPAVADQPSQRTANTLDDSPRHNRLEPFEPKKSLNHRSKLKHARVPGSKTHDREAGAKAMYNTDAPAMREGCEHDGGPPPSGSEGDHINAAPRFRRVQHIAASPNAGHGFTDTLRLDTVKQRNISPPQDRRPQSRARYGNPATVPKSGGGVGHKPHTDSITHTNLQQKMLVERTARWAERGSMWLPYSGSYVRVVADAVVDALRHPYADQLVKHRDVPVMMMSSAAETAADVHSSLQCACLEKDENFDYYQEPLEGGGFRHTVPVVILQACRHGTPGADDLILQDIDERLDAAHRDDAPQPMDAQRVNTCPPSSPQILNEHATLEPHEKRTPPTLLAHRRQVVLETPVETNEPVAARALSQPAPPQICGPSAKGNTDIPCPSVTPAQEERVHDEYARSLLEAVIRQYPNLINVLQRPEGKHIADMWYGSAAMQEYGAPALFVLAAAVTGYPIEFFRSTRTTWTSVTMPAKEWLWNNQS